MAETLTTYRIVGVETTGDKALTFSIEPPVPMTKHGILNGTVDTLMVRSRSEKELQEDAIDPVMQKMRENHAISTRNIENRSLLTVDFASMGLGTDYIFGVGTMRRMLSGIISTSLEKLG